MEGLTVTKAIVMPNLPFTLEIFVNFKNKIQIDWVIFLLVYTSIQCQLNCTAAERIVAAALILCAEQNMLEQYLIRRSGTFNIDVYIYGMLASNSENHCLLGSRNRVAVTIEWVCHILGGSMWKSTSRAFRICMTKGVGSL